MISKSSETNTIAARYPCSFAQAECYAVSIRRPRDPALNISMRWRVRGTLGPGVLERSWGTLVSRHEMLRTTFVATEDGVEQVVRRSVGTHVSVVDCSALDPAIVEDEIARIAAVDVRAAFDLATAPLWRMTRLILGPSESVLLVTAHEIACDGWSFGLIARELGSLCAVFSRGEKSGLAAPQTTYGEFALWERSVRTKEMLAEEFGLLQSDFSSAPEVDIGTDLPRPSVWTSRVDTRSRALDVEAMRRFLEEARKAGRTAFVAMLAVSGIVLAERSSTNSIAVTTQVVGRDDVDLENVVGPFVNSIPLRLEFAAAASIGDVISRVGDMLENALELRHVPFSRIVERVMPKRADAAGPTRGINFLYQKAFAQDADYGIFRIESEHSRPGGSRYDLNLYVVERPSGWRLSCDYNPDLYALETIEILLDRFEKIVAGGIDRRESVLFFHSDLFADGYYAEQVAAAITRRRVVPIGPHGIGTRPLLPTIDAMARDYVATIDAVQQKGPYRLLGFCSGALVAFEVARLLRERGETVEQLVLINATAPVRPVLPFRDFVIRRVATNPRLSPRVREVICYNFARLNRALISGPRASFVFARKLASSAMRRPGVAGGSGGGEDFVRARGEALSEISFAHIGAALSHHPHRYDGEVTLIWSADQTNLTGEATQGWNRLAASVNVVRMSGGHVAPLHELIGELSEILGKLL